MKNALPRKGINYKRIALHLLYWFVLMIALTVLYSYKGKDYLKYLHMLLYTYPLDISISYFTIYFTIPYFLINRRYVGFAITFLLSFGFILFVERIINYYWAVLIYHPEYHQYDDFLSFSILRQASDILMVVGYTALIKISKQWYETQRARTELEKQNMQSELALLRSQINPHFLFNTINNIYSLVYKKSDEAPAALMKLSDIMRYMLYDTNAEKVELEKEVSYIKSFIELQQLRLRTENFVTFEIIGNIEGKLIPPMLLIPFVENAFKHGTKKITPGILIKIRVNEKSLNFEVTNHMVFPTTPNKEPYSGIGLQNVKRRLDLLFPQKHLLIAEQEGEVFHVNLFISHL